MATIWVSTSGTDTATGTNLGAAVKTLGNAVPKAGPNGTVNMVNDGDHPARATGLYINLTYSGTNFTTNPGLIVQGVDASGDPAMCTVAMTAGAKRWLDLDDGCEYVWVQGMRFDYTALRGTAETAMYPVLVNANMQNLRLSDNEIILTTAVGSSVNLATNTNMPRFPYVISGGSSSAGTIEVYNNVYINSRMYCYNPANADLDIHNNVFVHDAADFPGSTSPNIWTGGSADELRRFSQNTIVAINYDADTIQPSVTMNQNNTTNLAFHSNLFFIETGSNAAALTNYLLDGATAAAQSTTVVTCSNNYVAIGTILASESTAWDTSTGTGIFGRQLNSAWRGGGSENGTALNTDDVFGRGVTLAEMFNDYTSSYTWTPGDYSHDLPTDLRPLLGRTDALGGGVVGAIDDAVNADPVVIAHTYTGTSGVLKTTSGTDGVLEGSSDPDGDTLTATVVADVSHGVLTLNTTTGGFEYTPNITYVGTDTFTYKAWDGTTFSNVSTATINISNQTPTAYPMNYYTGEGHTLSVTSGSGLLVRATDPDVGQTLSVTDVGTPGVGTLVSYNITTGSFIYRPGPFASGLDSFTFKVTDGNTRTAAMDASIYVVPAADPVEADIIDTAPFFRPSLYVETEFRTRWKKNRKKALNEANYTDDREWNESTSRTIVITPAATTTITLGGIASAKYLILETDYPVEVSIDGTDKYWPVSKVLAVALTDFSSVALKSVSATNAQVILTVVD